MRYDFLAEPVSEAEPCGPDLEETFDPAYANVTAEAASLVPQRFYDRSREKIFDRSVIDLPVQEAAITGLLKRSRDIRLLVLDARLQLLAGKLSGFSDALAGLVIVVSTFWDQFHPLPFDGDMIVRQNTLEGLDDLSVIVPALQFAPVLEGRARISYRNFLVASGTIEPWPGEEPANQDTLERALRDEQSRPQLTASHAATLVAIESLATLRTVFIDKAGHVNAPAFDKVVQALTGLRAFLEDFLGIAGAATQSVAEGALPDGSTAAAGGTVSPAHLLGSVTSHASAMSALVAAERYFLTVEPSSPAVILIHQARQLIGRPLVEALAALLPEPSAYAALRFDSGFRFNIDISRMKSVTEDMLSNASAVPEDSIYASGESSETGSHSFDESESASGGEAVTSAAIPAEAEAPATFTVSSRQEATHLLSTVESFFKVVEPSSPVALLLSRARGYIGKDFAAILNELLPPASSND